MGKRLPRIDSEFVANLLSGEVSVKAIAKEVQLSETELRKLAATKEGMVKNPGVHLDTVSRIATYAGKNVEDIVFYDKMPLEAKFYETLKFAIYVDNFRHDDSGEHGWFCEELMIKRLDATVKFGHRLKFEGSIINCNDVEFDITAELVNDHLFYVIGYGRGKDFKRSFVGCLNNYKFHEDLDVEVICGTWSAIDINGDPAVFKWILSTKVIGIDLTRTIAKRSVLRTYKDPIRYHHKLEDI